MAVHSFDHSFDHIKTHAASGLIPTLSAVENPGAKINFNDFRFRTCLSLLLPNEPRLDCFRSDLRQIQSGAIVFDLNDD